MKVAGLVCSRFDKDPANVVLELASTPTSSRVSVKISQLWL
jgi:hypothetical protein